MLAELLAEVLWRLRCFVLAMTGEGLRVEERGLLTNIMKRGKKKKARRGSKGSSAAATSECEDEHRRVATAASPPQTCEHRRLVAYRRRRRRLRRHRREPSDGGDEATRASDGGDETTRRGIAQPFALTGAAALGGVGAASAARVRRRRRGRRCLPRGTFSTLNTHGEFGGDKKVTAGCRFLCAMKVVSFEVERGPLLVFSVPPTIVCDLCKSITFAQCYCGFGARGFLPLS